MSFKCKLCETSPTSHSFEKLKKYTEKNVFYTCPSIATNNEISGIIEHYDGVLKELNADWVWVIDFNNFTMKNFLNTEDSFKLIQFITLNHITKLQKILVINQNIHVNNIYTLIKPMLNKKLKSKIVFYGKTDLNSLIIE
jgi:beta-glucanase (GH16 family)